MSYLQSQMLYYDEVYYKWKAKDDHDNPHYRNGADHTFLNRTERYEVLYFINHLAVKRWTAPVGIDTYKKIEKMN